MNRVEWTEMAARIDAWWPASEFTEDVEAIWFEDLERFDFAEVRRSLEVLKRRDSAFAPSIGELLHELEVADPDMPTWTEAWSLIDQALYMSEPRAMAFLGAHHLVLQGFVRLEGFTRLTLEPLRDPDFGLLRIRELGQRFDAYAQRARERLEAGQSLERATSGELRSGEPRKLDPASSLPQPYFRSELPTRPPGGDSIVRADGATHDPEPATRPPEGEADPGADRAVQGGGSDVPPAHEAP